MRCWQFSDTFLDALITRLARTHRVVAPCRDDDDVVRLHEVAAASAIACGMSPLLPLKKYLFPSPEILWRHRDGQFREPPREPPLAALALPPCDLQAVDLLDRALGEDPGYTQRRRGLIRIAARCTPNQECRCLAPDNPPPCDLFLADDRAWSFTSAGDELAAGLAEHLTPLEAPPGPDLWPARSVLPSDLADRFAALVSDPLWDEPTRTCLACGACSAVCPTCFCFDVQDHALPGGEPWRERGWDNCLFDSFAVVAGGHDFRPGYRSRLQFRMHHKLLGFGELEGVPSCVGCSRCREHCPVAIGPQELLAKLCTPEGSP